MCLRLSRGDLCDATEGFAAVWRREGWSAGDMARWADGDVLTLVTLARWLRMDALTAPGRVEDANMLAGWRAKYENEITVRMKSSWWRGMARKQDVGVGGDGTLEFSRALFYIYFGQIYMMNRVFSGKLGTKPQETLDA